MTSATMKSHTKIEFCVRLPSLFCDYSMFVTLYKISEFHLHLLDPNGFHAKAKNERFTAMGFHCRQNLKNENFLSSFVQKLHQDAHSMCSTIIFPHSTNQNHLFVALALALPLPFLKLPSIFWTLL